MRFTFKALPIVAEFIGINVALKDGGSKLSKTVKITALEMQKTAMKQHDLILVKLEKTVNELLLDAENRRGMEYSDE